MELSIETERIVAGLPSGSGIAKHGELYFAIGDDSPFLFTLDQEFQVIDQMLIIDNPPSEYRIKKDDKPDFEAMELINDNELVVFGSGSKSPERDIFIRILLEEAMRIERYDLTDFYQNIKEMSVM